MSKPKSIYPWLVWFLASSFILYKYVLQVSPSVMVPELMHTFSLSGQAMGVLAAFYFYAYLITQTPAGVLLDYYNPRKLMAVAISVCAFGGILFSQAPNLGVAEMGRLLIGCGAAFSAVGTMKLVSIWFAPKKFALMSGLMMTMAMLGAIIAGAPLSFSTGHIGWRYTMLVVGLCGFSLALLIWFCIKDHPSHLCAKKPRQSFSFKQLTAGFVRVIRLKQSWIISFYSGLAFAPISAFAGLWGVPYLTEQYQMPKSLIAGIVSTTFISFAIGSPLAGWLSNRIGRRKPIMIVGTIISMLSLTAAIYIPVPLFVLPVLLAFFGFFSGFFFVSFALIREIHWLAISGASIAFINMFNALFGAISEPLVGKLLDIGWSHHLYQNSVRYFTPADYRHALVVLPIGLLIALILQFFVRESYCRPIEEVQDTAAQKKSCTT